MDKTGILSVSMSWMHVRVIIWTLFFVGICTSMGPCSGISCLIGCGIPPPLYEEHHITTSERNNGYRIGNQIVYHCEKNYIKVGGSAESRCTAQGTWTTPTLRCKIEGVMLPEGQIYWTVVTPPSKSQDNQGEPHQNGGGSSVIRPGHAYNEICGEPPKPSGPHSVRFKVGHPHASGSSVSYGCKEGYKYISGPTSTRCRRHGAWDPKVIEIKCDEKRCVQPTLPGKDQTSQSDIYQVGTSITFSCREGYELIGESLLVCLENETWSNTYPRCVLEGVMLPEGRINWTMETPSSKSQDNQGEPHQNGGGSNVIRPGLANSEICGEPPRPSWPHSVRLKGANHRTSGSRVSYGCEEGYKYISGPTSSRCRRPGAWEPEVIVIKCQEKGCVLPTLPGKDQTSQSDIHRVGTKITFSCREGYELIGESQQVCQEDETWSNTHPRCVPSKCGTPTQPHYGRIKPHQHSYVYGSDVRYVCNHGYTVVGETYRTCLGDKTWSGKLPTCQVMDCGFPNVSHADIFLLHNTTTYPSAAQIKCKTGTSRWSFCNPRGKWHPHVKCKESETILEPTTIVDDLFTAAQHSLDRREFSTQLKNYDPGVYQESVSSGYRTHLMWPFTHLPLILYILTYWI